MTDPSSSGTSDTPVDPDPPSVQASALDAESALLEEEDKQFDDLDDTLDDDKPESAQPIEGDDVERDADQLGPAPVGTTLTADESAGLTQQAADIVAANQARDAGEQIDLSPEAVN